MKSDYALLGIDTAWRRFESAQGGRKSAFDEKMRALEAATVGLNLEPESVHLAAEIAAFEPALEADERIALIVLMLVSLAALQEGSTRFPIVGPISREPMRRMLDALCANGFGPDASERISNSIEDLIRSNRASAVIGRDKNEYKPLLFLTPYIFHQRIQRIEFRLANRLASMLVDGADSRFDSIELKAALNDVFSRPVIVEGRAIAMSPSPPGSAATPSMSPIGSPTRPAMRRRWTRRSATPPGRHCRPQAGGNTGAAFCSRCRIGSTCIISSRSKRWSGTASPCCGCPRTIGGAARGLR